jgi:uncharacterized protein YndB with AHSA1/START domain
MHGPNGANFENDSMFLEIVDPERIVFRHVSPPQFEMTITLADDGGRTLLTWRQEFPTPADRDRVKGFAVEANEQNLDRLEAELARGA